MRIYKTTLTIILMSIILGSLFACANIKFLGSGKDTMTVKEGYGVDPASMIATDIVTRNKFEPFVNSKTIFEKVYFGPNSADIDAHAKEILWKKILWLEENPNTVVVIEGHSDKSGDETANLIVGERRAESVRNFLVKMGVDGKRLITVSYGEEHLADPGNTKEGQAKNRRVTFSIR
jgi:peptidoglycan-associated lipoprotein